MRGGLFAVRVAWVMIAVLGLAITVFSIPLLFEQYNALCREAAGICLERSQLSSDGLRRLEAAGISLGLYVALVVGVETFARLVWVAVGALVFMLRSGDRMALLVAFFLVAFGTATFATTGVDILVSSHPAWWVPARGLQVLGEVFTVLFFLTFPNGRFVPRWTPWLAVAFLAFQVPGDLFPGLYSGSPVLEMAQTLVFMCCVLGMLGSQVYRYRRTSTPEQRRQTKWVVFGTTLAISSLFVLLAPLLFFAPRLFETSPFVLLLLGGAIPLVMLLIPLSIGVAVLRSGLFDIDLVINRALVYGTLTASLALVYIGAVVVLQQGFRAHGTGIPARGRRLDSWDSRPVQPVAAAHTGLHRPPLLPEEVRCCPDSGGVQRQASGRDGSGHIERRSGLGGAGDGAAGARLAMVEEAREIETPENSSETFSVTLFVTPPERAEDILGPGR
ncbi:MAG: hypothetical protein H0U02_12870 [Rubrobacter sp.]|jgi:hypothetical protein|nr:hypothetical protein [Rubrobacter sp.]MBA3792179.1 hypothetical protein [Rubrobacter sp.]